MDTDFNDNQMYCERIYKLNSFHFVSFIIFNCCGEFNLSNADCCDAFPKIVEFEKEA